VWVAEGELTICRYPDEAHRRARGGGERTAVLMSMRRPAARARLDRPSTGAISRAHRWRRAQISDGRPPGGALLLKRGTSSQTRASSLHDIRPQGLKASVPCTCNVEVRQQKMFDISLFIRSKHLISKPKHENPNTIAGRRTRDFEAALPGTCYSAWSICYVKIKWSRARPRARLALSSDVLQRSASVAA
jgi:hypothetical protein